MPQMAASTKIHPASVHAPKGLTLQANGWQDDGRNLIKIRAWLFIAYQLPVKALYASSWECSERTDGAF
jgi:hypothetical protein